MMVAVKECLPHAVIRSCVCLPDPSDPGTGLTKRCPAGWGTETDRSEMGPPTAVIVTAPWSGLLFSEVIVSEPGLTRSTPAAGVVGAAVVAGGDEAGGADDGWAGVDWVTVG